MTDEIEEEDEVLMFIIIATVVATAVMIVGVLTITVIIGKRRWKKHGIQIQEPIYDYPSQLHILNMNGSGRTFQSPIQLKENVAYTNGVLVLPFSHPQQLKENVAYGALFSQQQENWQHLPVSHT